MSGRLGRGGRGGCVRGTAGLCGLGDLVSKELLLVLFDVFDVVVGSGGCAFGDC